MPFIKRSWNAVSQETIRNCWDHVGLINRDGSSDVPSGIDTTVEEEVDAYLKRLDVDDVTGCDFIDVDNDLEISVELTDEQIIEMVTRIAIQDQGDECDDEVPQWSRERKIRAYADAIIALSQDCPSNSDVQCLLTSLITSHKAEEHKEVLERSSQSKVTDFFGHPL